MRYNKDARQIIEYTYNMKKTWKAKNTNQEYYFSLNSTYNQEKNKLKNDNHKN